MRGSELPVQIQPFAHFMRDNSPGFNTSRKFAIFCNPLIRKPFNPTRINTSGNKDLKSLRINTSGSKDLKSFRINTSKKHGSGEGSSDPEVYEPAASALAGSRPIGTGSPFEDGQCRN